MTATLLPENTLKPDSFDASDLVIFGGTFDPLHLGHLGALNRLRELFALVIIAPTTENPWKGDRPTPLPLRVQMITLALQRRGIPLCSDAAGSGVYVYDCGYHYAEELVRRFRRARGGKVYWAVGEDIAHEVGQWKNWPDLDVATIVVPIRPPVHAADVRRGSVEVLPELKDFVSRHGLYAPPFDTDC